MCMCVCVHERMKSDRDRKEIFTRVLFLRQCLEWRWAQGDLGTQYPISHSPYKASLLKCLRKLY